MARPKKTPKNQLKTALKTEPGKQPVSASADTAPTQPSLPENKFPVVVKTRGRPSDYSEYTAGILCARIVEGESLKKICRDEDMPGVVTVFQWLRRHTDFAHQYALAMEQRAETHVEEMFEIADDVSNDTIEDPETGKLRANSEWINRSRLRVDVRKWHAGRMKPKKYGDKVIQEVTGDGGGPVQHQVAQITLRAEDLDPDARETLRQALLTARKPAESGE